MGLLERGRAYRAHAATAVSVFAAIAIAIAITGALAEGQVSPAQPITRKLAAPAAGPAGVPAPAQLELKLPNFDFELGLDRWSKTGTAFDAQPIKGHAVRTDKVRTLPVGGTYWRGTFHPVGHRGTGWLSTALRTKPQGDAQGDRPVGALTSEPVVIDKRFVTFLIGGSQAAESVRFEILEPAPPSINLPANALRPAPLGNLPVASIKALGDAKPAAPSPSAPPAPPRATSVPVAPDLVSYPEGAYRRSTGFTATGSGSELLRRAWWDVSSLRGKTVRLRVVDDSPGGHINLDDIRFEDRAPDVAKTVFNDKGVWRDTSFPVWGFADLHTHPMSHLGFGGRLMHGTPDGDLNQSMGDCNLSHGGWGLDNTGGNYVRAALVNQMDEHYVHKTENVHGDHQHEGAPGFRYWPHFTSITHQQMRIEAIRRAYEGGLRVMVALAVNNQLLADATDGDAAPHDDKASADLQLVQMRKFVARHSFMGIAKTAAELRTLVREDKLAVVLGVEVDNLGNFHGVRVPPTPSAVRAEIERLFREHGVRYIFPIHMTDNRFGGAAVYGDLFNIANRYANTQPLPPEFAAWVPGTGYRIEHAPDPLISYRLKPHMDGFLALGIKGLLEGMEQMPSPYPFANCCTDFLSCAGAALSGGLSCAVSGPPTFGAMLRGEREYQVVKHFFLTPDPLSASYARVAAGHRNAVGMTALGESALRDMMELGMLIDIDHMSEKAVECAVSVAESISDGGYPLASGHNGFRALVDADERNENKRSDAQLARLEKLGGLMGVGYGYHKSTERGVQVERVLSAQGAGRFTSSVVDSTCGGSARTFAQSYLYAIEKLGTVAFGTDANGMVMGPGPRYGALSRLAGNYCPTQNVNQRVRYAASFVDRSPFPLVQAQLGSHRWDINEEGVAHYGMLPDFLEDMTKVGLRSEDLSVLFRSAEDFARAWERAEQAATRVPRSAAQTCGG